MLLSRPVQSVWSKIGCDYIFKFIQMFLYAGIFIYILSYF